LQNIKGRRIIRLPLALFLSDGEHFFCYSPYLLAEVCGDGAFFFLFRHGLIGIKTAEEALPLGVQRLDTVLLELLDTLKALGHLLCGIFLLADSLGKYPLALLLSLHYDGVGLLFGLLSAPVYAVTGGINFAVTLNAKRYSFS